jgi:hypothetical protein
MSERRKGSFKAVGATGQTYTVIVWVGIIDAGTLVDPHAP